MAARTYAQVAQVPPHQAAPHQVAAHQAVVQQAAPHSTEETRRRQEITRGKRAADGPQAARASGAAPRAHAPPIPMSDLHRGPETTGMSHLLDDLCRYVSLLVR